MIINTIIDEIKNKSRDINTHTNHTYETKTRINYINNCLHSINEMLDDIQLEFNRDRKYVSNTVKQMIIENDKKNHLLETFLPYMTLYSIMKNDDIEDNYQQKYIENELDITTFNK